MEMWRRFEKSLHDRLAAFAQGMREKATTNAGAEREGLLRRTRQAETFLHLQDWANSPGLQAPR